ncbi:MAG: CRISPR-associated endonuclease Cas2 [Lachnospiraceae bacterium]|nr:CRISPR-associated endonuclease Cas2 [Lachnospiraceae bacterium]
MLVLITYDVNTQTAMGVKRLSRVARICTNYGQRVQNSVFECLVDATQFAMLKKQLADIIDVEKDSIRYYILGEQYKSKVEHVGKENGLDMSGILIC